MADAGKITSVDIANVSSIGPTLVANAGNLINTYGNSDHYWDNFNIDAGTTFTV